MKYLLLFILFFVFANGNIYRDNGREVVVDDEAKLMWVDNISVIKILKSHEDAADFCKETTYLGLNDWRLAKAEEFELIVDKQNTKNYINKAFRYNVPDGYWAQKAHWRTLWFYADYMNFISGTVYYDNRKKLKYVRCIREY